MINITFNYSNSKTDVIVNRTKYIKYHNCSVYWMFNRCFQSACTKRNTSKFREETHTMVGIDIDGEHISKSDEFYYVDSKFNIDEDLKLGAKSLSLKYLSSTIEKNLYSDETHQLNLMLDIISTLFSSDNLKLSHQEINQKTLPKLLVATYTKNEFEADELDIEYDELIIMQIRMIYECSNASKRTIVFVDVVYLTEKIYEEIERLSNRLIFIVLFCKGTIPIENDNIWYNGFDLENDNDLYERMNVMTNYYDIIDFKNFLKAEYLINS